MSAVAILQMMEAACFGSEHVTAIAHRVKVPIAQVETSLRCRRAFSASWRGGEAPAMVGTKPLLERPENGEALEVRRTSHGDDLYTGALEQAALLRSGRLDAIDAANLADEIDDVGSAQCDELESASTVLLLHLLKWDHQPERRSRSGQNSIREQRRRVLRQLARNPGSKARLDEALREACASGRDRASTETDRDVVLLPPELPYSFDDIMNRDYPLASQG